MQILFVLPVQEELIFPTLLAVSSVKHVQLAQANTSTSLKTAVLNAMSSVNVKMGIIATGPPRNANPVFYAVQMIGKLPRDAEVMKVKLQRNANFKYLGPRRVFPYRCHPLSVMYPSQLNTIHLWLL